MASSAIRRKTNHNETSSVSSSKRGLNQKKRISFKDLESKSIKITKTAVLLGKNKEPNKQSDQEKFKILGDLVFFPREKKTAFIFETLRKIVKFDSSGLNFSPYLRKIRIILLSFHLYLAWDILIFMLTLSLSLLIPIQIGFAVNLLGEEFRTLTIFSIIAFIINIPLGMKRQKKIHFEENQEYPYFKMLMSILSILSLFLALWDFSQSFFDHLPFLLFLYPLFELKKDLISILKDRNLKLPFLVRFAFVFMFFSHFAACLLYYVSSDNQTMFIDLKPEKDISGWFSNYLTALFFIISIITSNGMPGEGLLGKEKFFFLLLELSSLLFFLQTFGCRNTINEGTFNEKELINLKNWIKEHKVEEALAEKVQKKIENSIKDENIHLSLEKLPSSLRIQLLESANSAFLSKIEFLSNQFSKETIKKLAACLKESHYFPQEIISCDQSNPSLFIIKKGKFNVFMNTKKSNCKPIKTFDSGRFFNEMALFGESEERIQYMCEGFSEVLTLQKEDFVRVLRENTDDYEVYCQIKNQVLLGEKLMGCVFCDSKSDCCMKNCPQLNIKLPKPKFNIKALHYSSQQIRQVFARKTKYKLFNSLKSRKLIQERLRYLEMTNPPAKTMDDDDLCNSWNELNGEFKHQFSCETALNKLSLSELDEKKYIEKNLEIELRTENDQKTEEFEKVCCFKKFLTHNNVDRICAHYNEKAKKIVREYEFNRTNKSELIESSK